MNDPLQEARIRARRHGYRDGLLEIPLGVITLLMGVFDLLALLSGGTAIWYLLSYTALMTLLALSASRIMAAVRERVTYPRSGYVHESGRERRVAAGMIAGLVMMVACVMFIGYARNAGWDADRWAQWLPALGGLMTAAIGVYVTVRYGMRRFLMVGVFAFVLGVVVSIEYSFRLAEAIWLAGVGCAWLSSGAIALKHYLRTVPPTVDAT